jgi:hypothetical protein
MRAVLETNVVVSALIWGGTPFAVLQAASEGGLLLFTSSILLGELREVLARPHLASRLEHQRGSVEEARPRRPRRSDHLRRPPPSGAAHPPGHPHRHAARGARQYWFVIWRATLAQDVCGGPRAWRLGGSPLLRSSRLTVKK